MDDALAQALWTGPLPDPDTPARDLARAMAGGLAYGPAVTRLRQLARHGLPLDPAMALALRTYPGSIDVALVALQADLDGSLEALAQRVSAQNRRRAVLGWALWSRGQTDAARAALDDLDPSSDSFQVDRAARAELAILSGDDPGPIEGPQAARLGFLRDYRVGGAAALAARFDTTDDTLPADPALWSWLIDTWISETDFTRARAAFARMARALGSTHDAVRTQRIRLALDCDEVATARRLLDAEGDGTRPWLWPPRRLAQQLRCSIAEVAGGAPPEGMRELAQAAARIAPGNTLIAHLTRTVALMTGDWDELARQWSQDAPADTALTLARIGLPDPALALLATAPDGPPDAKARWRLHRAQIHLMRGTLEDAEAALETMPTDPVHRAADAYWRAEIALARRDHEAALAILDPALAVAPTRMGLVLSLARARFMAGEFAAATEALARFRSLKTAQLGTPPADDLRDRITTDAARADPNAETTSPGLAARALALAPPTFKPHPGARIPPRLAHYWEGPRSAPLLRGLRAWARHHPGADQTLFDPATAAIWLAKYAPDLSDLFARLTQPATRADLFRLAWITRAGGIFADLDEYPRAPVTDWLQDARAVLVIEQGYGTVANNFLAAEPGLPLFQAALERVTRALRDTDSPYPWWHSGPAQLTPPLLKACRDPAQASGLRVLAQRDYDARVSTNLPFPHKRGPDHWR